MRTTLALTLALAALGCKKDASDARSGDTAPTRYVQDLQQDVRKASAAQEQANQAIAQTSRAVEDALKAPGQ